MTNSMRYKYDMSMDLSQGRMFYDRDGLRSGYFGGAVTEEFVFRFDWVAYNTRPHAHALHAQTHSDRT
jgi:hypothetical protein